MKVDVAPSPAARLEVTVPENLLGAEKFDDHLEAALMDIAIEGRNFWETTAGQRLATSRQRYQEAIGMEQVGQFEVHLRLKGEFARKVEMGSSGFDLKPGFLASDKVKTQKKKLPRAIAASLPRGAPSKYLIIPLNLSRKTPMGYPDMFRTVTDKSPPSSWKHPGFKAKNIRLDVKKELQNEIIPRHLKKLIKTLETA